MSESIADRPRLRPTDQKRKKMQAGRNDSDGEIAELKRVCWRTTDQDEIRLRQQRAQEEQPQIRNLEPTLAMPD